MSKQKRYLGGLVTLVAAALLIVFLWVSSVQGRGNDQIAVVDTQALFTEYLAAPLYEARDQLQAEYEEKSEGLSNEEAGQLFMEYQAKLEAIELEYSSKVDEAVAKVAGKKDLQVVVDASAVLYGGVDITEDVLAILK
ncbi:MAG: hypothetical protein GX228_03300 [Firmicutes bacterium]|jgi:outer membrane protein|nr:OmpH family outer membrane protein [Bacillota bacterium]NLL87947.1 hypothetical protein [Bacillota bacterium]HKM17727.1 hypothetical protein [Limnochordia bacterium]